LVSVTWPAMRWPFIRSIRYESPFELASR